QIIGVENSSKAGRKRPKVSTSDRVAHNRLIAATGATRLPLWQIRGLNSEKNKKISAKTTANLRYRAVKAPQGNLELPETPGAASLSEHAHGVDHAVRI